MLNIDRKIEDWKNKLLELSKRNRLISYRDTKRSSLRIVKPGLQKLWNDVVFNEHSLNFPYIDEEKTELLSDYNRDNRYPLTNQPPKEQQLTLKSLRSKARIMLEERGVNALYLAIGFIRWKEHESSSLFLLSPIILVPVTLSLERVTAPFVLNLYEDDIVLNPTLVYKFEHDFGVILPEFDEDCDIEEYFCQIEALISSHGWGVERQAGLSLFSFLKMNMYRDLDQHRDRVKANPIIRSLCGDSRALHDETIDQLNNYDHDNRTNPEETFQVVDADSSQQDAILSAKKGYSFILQGPPGTGKSQTITNIIAECLADGKKVLFVSEKMAALEVVHRRLTDAQLSDYCLTLHSHRTNKKDILNQLRNALQLSRKRASIDDEATQKLHQLRVQRNSLNDYAASLHKKIAPLNLSAYEVNGRLASLHSCPDVIFKIQDIASVSNADYISFNAKLSELEGTITRMSGDFRENPWYGANVGYITHELRHDAGSKLPGIVNVAKEIYKLFTNMAEKIDLVIEPSASNIDIAIEMLEIAEKSSIVPRSWILKTNFDQLAQEIKRLRVDTLILRDLEAELLANRERLETMGVSIKSLSVLSSSVDEIRDYIKNIEELIAQNASYRKWNEPGVLTEAIVLLSTAEKNANDYHTLEDQILSSFDQNVLKINFAAMLQRFQSQYGSVLKVIQGQYYKDKKEVRQHSIIASKQTDSEIVDLLIKVRNLNKHISWYANNSNDLNEAFPGFSITMNSNYRKIHNEIAAFNIILRVQRILEDALKKQVYLLEMDEELRRNYGVDFKGYTTDWELVETKLNWMLAFVSKSNEHKQSKLFLENICLDSQKVNLSCILLAQLQLYRDEFWPYFDWLISLFDEATQFSFLEVDFSKLASRCELLLAKLYLLDEWIDYRTAKKACEAIGLGLFVQCIEKQSVEKTMIVSVFNKRFYRLWLDTVLPGLPSVMGFRGRDHDRSISKFKELDTQQFVIAKARIQQKLISSLPSLDRFSAGGGELNILRRELAKQKRIMPIRKLFRSIPNLLLALKPCFMMSPLSVSLFLEADSYTFDTVVFDEASQVRTENAIGAISRGMQVIIAGDSKQLPPTNFFNSAISDTDFDNENDDDDEDLGGFESLLDEALLLPVRTLLWHYRSKHESLIAFSNAKIYNNSLITFPSSRINGDDNGVQYYYVNDGIYDRGGKKGNLKEAHMVAEMVFDHIRSKSPRSLGVIAFGEIQQQAIEYALQRLRIENEQYEDFFKEDRYEAFFIKNLENVQGDERDTIIFSIGYAKAPDGQMHMNFGPLSRVGGERRLNVAITRAKHNVKLVGSIMPSEIATDHITTEGPKLLRSYIEYAQNEGSQFIAHNSADSTFTGETPFERTVLSFLQQNGYNVDTKVGCSDYRIDIAVKHPSIEKEYAIGIECDGEMYHSARTSRERDRLRNEVLISMGWNLYRVWSTDWIKDPLRNGKQLMKAVEAAIALKNESSGKEGLKEIEIQIPQANMAIAQNEYLVLDNKDQSEDTYGFPEYKEIEPWLLKFPAGSDKARESICLIVNNEFPIHIELLCQRMAFYYGRTKATSVVRDEIQSELHDLKDQIECKGEFLYPLPRKKIVVKMPNTRSINHVSIDELAEAMYIIASKSVGSTEASLIQEVAREYGYSRVGANISLAMKKALVQLRKVKRVSIVEGKVVAQKNSV